MGGVCVCAYFVQNVRPAFHCDALEDGEHGEADVVEVDDAVERTIPARAALDAHIEVARPGTPEALCLHGARYVDWIQWSPFFLLCVFCILVSCIAFKLCVRVCVCEC